MATNHTVQEVTTAEIAAYELLRKAEELTLLAEQLLATVPKREVTRERQSMKERFGYGKGRKK